MGTGTKIEWVASQYPDGTWGPGHTWNPWRGCEKVSEGCTNCYAETMSHRNPAVLGEWGPDGTRAMASEDYWRLPFKWDRLAAAEGRRHRVFSLSLGDWLEDRPELIAPRDRLLSTIDHTPHLDWLLLTKRPEGWDARMCESARAYNKVARDQGSDNLAIRWLRGHAPSNVWLGVSAENQEMADLRVPLLLQIPAAVRFVSAEPLLGPVNLRDYLADFDLSRGTHWGNLDWLIVGGESGPHARPMDPRWALALRDQCQVAGVAFFFKQWGAYVEWDGSQSPSPSWRSSDGRMAMVRGNTSHGGDLLDGRQYHEFPVGALP